MKGFEKLAAMFAYAASTSRTQEAINERQHRADSLDSGRDSSVLAVQLLRDENSAMMPESIHFETSEHDVAVPYRRVA